MADFSFLSDSEDSAVENLVSQAIDLSVLEQVASINICGASDSLLPTDLETRFRKLKSFPQSKPKLKTPPPYLNSEKKEASTSLNHCRKSPTSSSDEEIDFNSQFPSVESVKAKAENELKRSNKGKATPDSFSDEENVISPLPKAKPNDRMDSKPKSRSGYVSSPLTSSNSSLEALSPPRQTCCFWCSPKRAPRKKSKENRVAGVNLDTLDWGKNNEVLSDLSTFSLKDQRRKLKKALKEEEKISREAEKVVEWAKQASARMNVSAVQDVLSDDEIFK
ncbi:hypothetical protein HHK36_028317 [Tetracentron sinense]|uniref:Uncharacterized protein n=1 Tax=Tetracentron sinense TaxID=13715 RepID=A0A834YFK8_TETSI|nr:hypothetical protein HHK36_028317 [Tetracentron sinense]